MAIGLAPGQLWVKRDDLTSLAGGGNKTRKLELLCADARARGADILVTGGGPQSNHCRQTAAAAAALGLGCRLVLAGDEPEVPVGNVVLDRLLGADLVWAGRLGHHDLEERIAAEAVALDAGGRTTAVIPVGGASPVGVWAYALATDELDEQLTDVAHHVVAIGSGGTHAGLVLGARSYEKVLGVDVGARPDAHDAIPGLVEVTAGWFGCEVPGGSPRIDTTQAGDGYGAPTDAALEAMRLFARTEGLILDPVYTAKAGAGLVSGARRGAFGDGRVVFWHTGGMPALFAPRYAGWIDTLDR